MPARGTLCKASRKDGTPCQAAAGPSGFCIAHNPAHAETVAAARRKAGQTNIKKFRVRTGVHVKTLIEHTVNNLLNDNGTMKPGVVIAMSGILNSFSNLRANEIAEKRLNLAEKSFKLDEKKFKIEKEKNELTIEKMSMQLDELKKRIEAAELAAKNSEASSAEIAKRVNEVLGVA